MDKYNKKNWLVFFFARHFYTGNGKRHGLAPAPVRRGTMAEKDRKGGGGSHRCSGADDESGSGELSSSSADIRGGPGRGVDGKGAQSSG
jgi:hypothetical protein